MAQIAWKQEFSVGNTAIDDEHEHLIEQINQLYYELDHSADSATIEAMLADIQAAISTHFALEELLMQEAEFAEFGEHREDHQHLLDQIHDMIFSFFIPITALAIPAKLSISCATPCASLTGDSGI